jgi:hypothetical protein
VMCAIPRRIHGVRLGFFGSKNGVYQHKCRAVSRAGTAGAADMRFLIWTLFGSVENAVADGGGGREMPVGET